MRSEFLYLASASPRRSALLRQIGVSHRVMPVDVDETPLGGESPSTYVSRLAAAKAQTLWAGLADSDRAPVLGSDTTVALGNELYGKPLDRADGIRMLQSLAGRTHAVHTAVALRHERGIDTRVSVSEVTFAALGRMQCEAYWDSGEPDGKAGGYAVQGLAATFITRIAGSYSGIMGLPLAETADLLSHIGWTLERMLKGVKE
jgi:septum formation protein